MRATAAIRGRAVIVLLVAVTAAAFAGCGDEGGDEGGDEAATLPTALEAPGTEDELAFCLGRLADPQLDDDGRFELVAECTGLERAAFEDNTAFVAGLSGVARSAPNDRVQERVDTCLVLFGKPN
jgi:hypothetical protein